MGRKGMKGFLKGVHKHHGSDDETADAPAEQSSTSAPKPAASQHQQQPQPQAPKPSEKAAARDDASDDGSGDDEGGSKGAETRGQLLQRHKREMVAHKKAVQKLGSKKKDEAAKLTAEVEARHARELRELEEREKAAAAAPAPAAAAGPSDADGTAAAAAEGAAEGLAGMALGGGAAGDQRKPSKAQKRREKLAQQEVEREQRIASEQAALGPSERALEEEQLRELLAPLRLGVREIRADGHCLYRAVEDQLAQAAAAQAGAPAADGASAGVPDYLALRRLAASHIRSHADDFLPFIFDEDAEGGPEAQLEAYCAELEGSAVWGGQLELGALAQALKRHIKVYACGMPPVSLGEEHAGGGGGAVQLCYLRHAFGLGEHYNSVQPLGAGPAGGGAGADAGAAAGAEA